MNARLHHLDLSVADLSRSTLFYDWLLPAIGFRRVADCAEGPLWAGDYLELGLQQAKHFSGAAHDRYAPGLHHLAFDANSEQAVDNLHRQLIVKGFTVLDAPAHYNHYTHGYYAVFFSDPDGIKLEYVFTPQWPE